MSSYYFTVEIDGIQTDRFFECEGLEMTATVFEVEEGGFNTSTHKRIGQNRSPTLILKKGVNKNNELINWYQNNINGKFERKNISVILMNSAYEEIRRWIYIGLFQYDGNVQLLMQMIIHSLLKQLKLLTNNGVLYVNN
jgi:phage tail-like protein